MKKPWQIWRDRRGRLSPLRIITLVVLLLPIGIAAHAYATTGFGARPLNDMIHRTGYWALIFLMLSLAVTPLRRVARFGNLIDVRRMIGVAAFFYIAAHLLLYIADQSFSLTKVASEIVLRLYLTIGFIALVGLAILAATSTDAMVKRLGGMNWRRLHQIIYVIGLLALIHFFQQTKADISVPVFVSGLFAWLMGYRLLAWWRRGEGELSTILLLALSVVVALLTFIGEAVGIGIAYRVSPWRVLQSAFDFAYDIRPGWYVLAAGLAVVIVDLLRGYRRAASVTAKTT
ncbi:MAG TPA: protein-methionine-sulfoxide reductase heme-binding subunit MsrQ [Pseudorhodoplanes sp.]|nr:protein-methionine-sulfoxide reductase heme-binding subunit MsrQ [Pseudorhodoplanes sp.]